MSVDGIIQGALNELKDSGAVTIDPGDTTPVETDTPSDEGTADPVAAAPESPDPPTAPEAPAPVAAAPAAAKPEVPDEEAELKALEAELVGKTPGLAKGKISQSRHQAVVTRVRRAAEAEVAALKDKYKTFDDPVSQRRLEGATWAETHPELFVQEVVMKHPAYQPHFEAAVKAEVEKRVGAPPPAGAAAGTTAPALPETAPEPDEVAPDGTLRYSLEGQRALARYEAGQLTKALQAKLDAMEKSVTPVLNEREQAARMAAAETRMSARITHARDHWDGFKEHEGAIRALILKPGNESMTLEEGYRQVVIPAFKADRARIEAEVKAEADKRLAAAPRVGAARLNGQAPPAAPAPTGPRSTEDIVREAYRGLKQVSVGV